MNKLVIIFCIFFCIPLLSYGQTNSVIDDMPADSLIIRFGVDSLVKTSFFSNHFLRVDTIGTMLWQIGHTTKTFFADSTETLGIMTDTVHTYPINASDWFVVEFNDSGPFSFDYPIIDFWHRYQTDLGKDGGIVEFSFDNGITWQNIRSDCNASGGGIRTYNIYAATDTLQNGEAAFSGTSNGEIFSRIQFGFGGSLGSDTTCTISDTIMVRFRFVSDSITDSFAGWKIDSIKLEHDVYESIPKLQVNKLHIYPNPSTDGQFVFPAMKDEKSYTIEVINVLGKILFHIPYTHNLNLSQYAKGVYFYKVTNGNVYYTGELITQ